MYGKVLLAADGSKAAKMAAQEVNKMIQQGLVKEVIILKAMPSLTDHYLLSPTEEQLKNANKAGKKVTAKAKELITGNAVITEKTITGDPAQVIANEAKKENCDLIVMGSRGMNPAKGLLLGSVSHRVLQLAPCPVLIVRQK